MAKLETQWTGIYCRSKEELADRTNRLKAEGYKTKTEPIRGVNGGYRVHVDQRREMRIALDTFSTKIAAYDSQVAALKQKYEAELAKLAEDHVANVKQAAELTKGLAELPALKPKI